MLRIEFHELAGAVMLRMEGRFVGEFAENARTLLALHIPPKLVVHLSEVTFVDEFGEHVLSWMKQVGSRFVAETAYSLDVCERLGLPVVTSEVGRMTRSRRLHAPRKSNVSPGALQIEVER